MGSLILSFIVVTCACYALIVLSVFEIIPVWIWWFIISPMILFGYGTHSWCRHRGWYWWQEILLIPLGFLGWLLVRLDIPYRLVPGYVSEYQLSLTLGQPFYISDDPEGNIMTKEMEARFQEARIGERPGFLMIPIAFIIDIFMIVWHWLLEHTLGYILKKYYQ